MPRSNEQKYQPPYAVDIAYDIIAMHRTIQHLEEKVEHLEKMVEHYQSMERQRNRNSEDVTRIITEAFLDPDSIISKGMQKAAEELAAEVGPCPEEGT